LNVGNGAEKRGFEHDKNWRPPQKTVVGTKVSLRGKLAELYRKVGKLETCIAKNDEQQTTKNGKSMTMARLVG
jgi:hypothetical protein